MGGKGRRVTCADGHTSLGSEVQQNREKGTSNQGGRYEGPETCLLTSTGETIFTHTTHPHTNKFKKK